MDAIEVLRAGLSPARRAAQVADELEERADERSRWGDYREAAVLRARAKAVRDGKSDPGWS